MRSYIQLMIVLMGFSYFNIYAQGRKISISATKQPLTRILEEIEQVCDYTIIYSNEIIPDTMLITFNAQRVPVAELLDKILPEKQLFYRMMSDRMLVIGSRRMNSLQTANERKTVLSGRVVDQKQNGVPFVSVGLLKDKRHVAGTTTNEQGYYQLAYAFEDQVIYELKASSMGYKEVSTQFTYPDTATVKQLTIIQEERTLATVNVVARRPVIERKADRFIVNVEGSSLALGFTGLEVLQKSPGVWVGSDGAIKLKGNQSVMVMINDVVQRMSSSDLAEFLRNLRSEDISKIEIISNPPSEFEAAGSGGIVHIILKKSRQDGLIGSLSTQYRQQEKRSAYSGNLSLNYKYKNLYLFGSLSPGKEESDYIATNDITYPDKSYYSSHTSRYNNNSRIFYRLGAAYDLSKNQSVTIQTIQTSSQMNQYFDTTIDFSKSSAPLTGFARSEWFRNPVQGGTTLNYALKLDSLGSGLKIIADYIRSTRTELNDFSAHYSLPEKNSVFRNNTPSTTNLYSMQSDFTKMFAKGWEFKAGLKFVATERDNEVLNEDYIGTEWVINTNLSNRFIYTENLSMAYASLNKTIGKISIKMGLRAEQTIMNGKSVTSGEKFSRDYLGFFPSVFIMRELDQAKRQSVYLSYSRRLQRPSFADLNPYRLQFDNYLTQLGNPDLLPEYTHKIELGSIFWRGFSADIYYSLTTDKIAQLASPVANNIIEYQTRNFSSSNEYGFSLDAPVKIKSWWNVNNSLALYNLDYKLANFKIKQTSLYARTRHEFSFKNLFDMDISVDYRSPYVNANTHIAYQYTADVGFARRFFNKNMQLRMYASDIFNTAREKNFTEYNGTRIDFYQKRPTRTYSLSLSYSYSSGKKFTNKKIEQSNDEEKRRLGN